MAPRAFAHTPAGDADTSYPESSPDPLAASLRGNNAKPLRKPRTTQKAPLTTTSPNKQSRIPNMADQSFELSSPAKSMIMNTGRPGGASPWRIKVTVEAEPGSGNSDAENEPSPTVTRMTRTTTTTVPLKGADSPSPVKRRGRPRKSEGATPAKKKRSGTPIRRRSKSKPRAPSTGPAGANEEDIFIDAVTQPKRRRGRPRKTPAPEPEPQSREPQVVEDAQDAQDVEDAEDAEDVPALVETRAIPTVSQETLFARRLREVQQKYAEPRHSISGAVCSYEEPVVTPPSSRTELSKRLRARRGTPAKGLLQLQTTTDEEEIDTPSETDDEPPAVNIPEPTPPSEAEPEITERIVNEAADDDDGEEPNDVTYYAFDEGATRMPDDTTLLESENFTMVSIDSLPSGKGLSSPAAGPSGTTLAARKSPLTIDKSYLQIPSEFPREARTSPLPSEPYRIATRANSSPAKPPPRYKTPVMEEQTLSAPPPIQPAPVPPRKTPTPKLRKVVKAGIALQGVLDPNHVTLTPRSSQKAVDMQQDRLDDLFKGFSDGTRRELQAGLRLGVQLARQSQERQMSKEPSLEPTPSQSTGSAVSYSDAFPSAKKLRNSRLITPEESDECEHPGDAQEAEVEYPSLNMTDAESQLLSPVASEDEMSWRVDTPPVVAGPSSLRRRFGTDNLRENNIGNEASLQQEAKPADYADIWQEEASRSSDELPSSTQLTPESEKGVQVQDLLGNDEFIKPARAKLPRTWRRKSSSDFHYSDEAEEVPQEAGSSAESDQPTCPALDKNKGKAFTPPVVEEEEGDIDDNNSEASDDTGMFFQSNLPNVFHKKRSTNFRRGKSDRVDLTTLMEDGSLLPESSPPVARAPQPVQSSPFKNTPPRFAALQASPQRSSPLRQEYRASDSEQSFQDTTINDRSRSVLPASSPFRTLVEGASVTSDAAQFRQEMEGNTDSTLRRVREEADAHAFAYSPQERTLHEIEEVTEQSRTHQSSMHDSRHQQPSMLESSLMPSSIMPSSPPQGIEDCILARKREYSPLFGPAGPAAVEQVTCRSALKRPPQPHSGRVVGKPKPAIVVEGPIEPQPKAQSGVFGRLTSNLWSAVSTPAPAPLHPILERFDPLPKYEPWTKTHYKTLDRLYQYHKKNPSLFGPSRFGNLSNTNNTLLTSFLAANPKHNFVGARFSSWGYSVIMDEGLVALAAVYMQVLKLDSIEEYERIAKKEIVMGDCKPQDDGKEIEALMVVQRLASVIMGEELRRDEKRGVFVEKVGGMSVVWPDK